MFQGAFENAWSSRSDPLWASGSPGGDYQPSNLANVWQDSAGTTPGAVDAPVGRIDDISGNANHAIQTVTASKPTIKSINGVKVLQGDFAGDYLDAPNQMYVGDLVVETPYGWQLSQGQQWNAQPVRLPLPWTSRCILHSGFSDAQKAALAPLLRGSQQLFIGLVNSSPVNNLRCYTGGATTVLTFIGSNAVTTTLELSANSDSSIDLMAAGLTLPALLLIPQSAAATLQDLRFFGNPIEGSFGVLAACPNLRHVFVYATQCRAFPWDLTLTPLLVTLHVGGQLLSGSRCPNISNLTYLAQVYVYSCGLVGPMPPLPAALTVFSAAGNDFTGNIQNLSANAALGYYGVTGSQLSGWVGGSVSATVATFLANDNFLPQSAVDGLLAAFVAAGRTSASGTCVLNLGGTGNATPSAAGLANKATLQARGWTVTTN